MTEAMHDADKPVRHPRLRKWLPISLSTLALVVIAFCFGFVVGWNWNVHVVESMIERAMQFKSDNDRLESELGKKNADYAALETRFTRLQAAMEAMVPSQNMYSVNPNQSVTVAGGRLTIGFVGLPTYESITVNLNGKQQAMSVGDTAVVMADSERCQVWVQSFDMFKATFIANCAPGTPQ